MPHLHFHHFLDTNAPCEVSGVEGFSAHSCGTGVSKRFQCYILSMFHAKQEEMKVKVAELQAGAGDPEDLMVKAEEERIWNAYAEEALKLMKEAKELKARKEKLRALEIY